MIVVVDFGSQYTHLIARRVRELGVYAEIVFPSSDFLKKDVRGLIFSGGPSSVYEENSPKIDKKVYLWAEKNNIPILGICYGYHLIAKDFGAKVSFGKKEYGVCEVEILERKGIFKGLGEREKVWMSHGDYVEKLPENFLVISRSNDHTSAFRYKNFYGIQFHPEVRHTEKGMKILENFVFGICREEKSWNLGDFVQETVERIRNEVRGKAIMALSGGVDSSVCAVLASKALGKNLCCVFVDHGLLRKNERERVSDIFSKFEIDFREVDAKKRFFERLKGIKDPEEKRRIIGEEFVRIFEKVAREVGATYLIQGTIYPDVIESGSTKHSDKIKSHHNLTLPQDLKLKVVEPIRELYKDEVRVVGRNLGLPKEITEQHPFPGPGLAVRVIGEVTEEKVRIARDASHILEEELERENIKVWQAFAVCFEDRVVGVVGDRRKFGRVVGLRVVESQDAMTANFSKLPWNVLERISTRITNEVEGVVSVTYFVSNKPPQTIEPC